MSSRGSSQSQHPTNSIRFGEYSGPMTADPLRGNSSTGFSTLTKWPPVNTEFLTHRPFVRLETPLTGCLPVREASPQRIIGKRGPRKAIGANRRTRAIANVPSRARRMQVTPLQSEEDSGGLCLDHGGDILRPAPNWTFPTEMVSRAASALGLLRLQLRIRGLTLNDTYFTERHGASRRFFT